MTDNEQLLLDFVLMRFQQSRDYALLAATHTVSRECHRRCLEFLRRHTRPTELVAGLSCEAQLQSISCRHWSVVLNIAGRTATTSDAEVAALVMATTPNLPQGDARKAIEAGLRVSYDQLVLAARLRIPGIEVWPKAHRQRPVIWSWGHYVDGATNRLHSFAECICCSFQGAGSLAFQQLLPQLSQELLVELLYLSVNVTAVATFVEDILQQGYRWHGWQQHPEIRHVSAESVHELLVTAITRRSFTAVNTLSYFPAARELVADTYTFTRGPRYHVDLTAAQLINNLAVLFNHHLQYGDPNRGMREGIMTVHEQEERLSILHHLCKVVCGSSACEAALLRVMLEVTERCASPSPWLGVRSISHLATLCDFPLAQQLAGDPVFSLLQAAVQTGSAAAASLVAALPGASMLSPQQVSDLSVAGAAKMCYIPGHFVAPAGDQHASSSGNRARV